MSTYYQDDLVTLHLGDCIEHTEWWVDADALITDPPYGLGGRLSATGSSMAREVGVQEWDKTLEVRDAALAAWEQHRPGRPYAMFGSPRRLEDAVPHREVPLVWDKGNQVGVGDTSFPWRPSYELIYVGGGPWKGTRGPAVLRVNHQTSAASKIGHPTPKPVGLMRCLIEKCEGTVADPFAGSGSTLLAAKQAGREAVGVEIDERYAEIAARRLAQGVLDLWGVGEPV